MDFSKNKAIYLQIVDFICEKILLKKWLPQEKIASIRELAVDLAVNPNTVARTYAYLEDKEIIKIERGLGYFVSKEGEHRVLAIKKNEFLREDLPQLFKTMDLLNIDLDHLVQLYRVRGKNEKK